MITAPITLLVLLGEKCPRLEERRPRTRIAIGGQERGRIKRVITLTPSSRSRRNKLWRGPEGLVGCGCINPLIRQIFLINETFFCLLIQAVETIWDRAYRKRKPASVFPAIKAQQSACC